MKCDFFRNSKIFARKKQGYVKYFANGVNSCKLLAYTYQRSCSNLCSPNGAIEKRIQMWKKYPEACRITDYKTKLMFNNRNVCHWKEFIRLGRFNRAIKRNCKSSHSILLSRKFFCNTVNSVNFSTVGKVSLLRAILLSDVYLVMFRTVWYTLTMAAYACQVSFLKNGTKKFVHNGLILVPVFVSCIEFFYGEWSGFGTWLNGSDTR